MDILIYRINGLAFGLAPVIWLSTMLVFITVIFSQVKVLGGWSLWEVIFLTGVHELIFIFSWAFFAANLQNLPSHVRLGSLDSFLLKPVSPKFLVSFRSFDFSVILSIVNSLAVFLFAFPRVVGAIDLARLAGFIFLGVLAMGISYSLYFIFASLSLFFTSSSYFFSWVGEVVDFDRYPAEIYSSWLRTFLFFGLPVLFLAYVPTAFLLEKIGAEYLVFSFLIFAVLSMIANFIWKVGVKRYQSASS
jgi:ABC-2 type transport system permease protein